MALFKKLRIRLGLKKDPLPPLPGVSIGRHTYGLHRKSFFSPHENVPVQIGSFCSVGPDVLLICAAEHGTEAATTFPVHRMTRKLHKSAEPHGKGPITVGNDVWLGARSIILSGVTIGNGAVIGAGSIVTKDIPPYAIAVGNPARVIRYRFAPEVIERLQVLEWWNWNDDLIRERIELLTKTGIERFLGAVEPA